MRGALLAAVLVSASCASRQPQLALEPFEAVRVPADDDIARRAFVAMLELDLSPTVDAGHAYGVNAPIVTPWIVDGEYRHRWLVYVRDGELVIDSVCFRRSREVAAAGYMRAAKETETEGECHLQPTGLSGIAKRIANRVGRAMRAPDVSPE